MTNEQILKKAIKKAKKNGWQEMLFQADLMGRARREGLAKTITDIYPIPYEAIIFSHSFAKAFWGEKKTLIDVRDWKRKKVWELELQNMVVEKESLKYIEKFL